MEAGHSPESLLSATSGSCEPLQKEHGGNSQWLSHLASTAGGLALIPGQKTKFLHARMGRLKKTVAEQIIIINLKKAVSAPRHLR